MGVYPGGFAAAEAEVLLRFGDVGARDYTIDDVMDSIAETHTGLEIASSPFIGINSHGPAVTASDYGNNKGLVLGPPIADRSEEHTSELPSLMRNSYADFCCKKKTRTYNCTSS